MVPVCRRCLHISVAYFLRKIIFTYQGMCDQRFYHVCCVIQVLIGLGVEATIYIGKKSAFLHVLVVDRVLPATPDTMSFSENLPSMRGRSVEIARHQFPRLIRL